MQARRPPKWQPPSAQPSPEPFRMVLVIVASAAAVGVWLILRSPDPVPEAALNKVPAGKPKASTPVAGA